MTVMEDGYENEVRGAWFPCPFCYVEIKVQVLCVHLQQEHCFDLRNAVCPICAANLEKDALGHFMMQHAHSIKWRNKSQKSGFWSNNNNVYTNIVRDFRKLSSFLDTNSLSAPCCGNEHLAPPDPLLSPFICTVPYNNPPMSVEVHTDFQQDRSSSAQAESVPSVLDEVEIRDYEERKQQAVFLQELLVSTILDLDYWSSFLV